jgi:hypothetical protein
MPPLLAALFMIEFTCDLRIVQAIDQGMEWRHYSDTLCTHRNWYDGWIGRLAPTSHLHRGAYSWPFPVERRAYAVRDVSPQ